ncbi:MAG: N-acetylmuramoyl-L-alanine amidase [Bacilli bacterium]|nr:N-acetylmuramoyl-L-alanine amidase [Bacilli bacterium]
MSNKYDFYQKQEVDVTFEKRLLPEGFPNRSGEKQVPEYIVIHEVSLGLGKSPRRFNMDRYLKKIFLDGFKGSTIGYHFLVGDEKIYQYLLEDEVTHHTGTKEGNRNSIGVERLICEGINHESALFNQAKLIATLMVKYNIPLDHVVTHRAMQKDIYNPAFKNYKLQMTGGNDHLKISKESFVIEVSYLFELYSNLLNDFPEVFAKDEKGNYKTQLIKAFNNWSADFNNTITNFDGLNDKQKLFHLNNVINFRCLLNRLYNGKKKIPVEPYRKNIDGILFEEVLDIKSCPNRLLAGQRGGLEKFKRQIQHCLNNGWLIEEVLNGSKDVEENNIMDVKPSDRTLKEVLSLPKVDEALKTPSFDRETPFAKLVTMCLMDYDENNINEILKPAEVVGLVESGYVVPTEEEWAKFVAIYNRIGDILDKPLGITRK